jgi:hypothetical protein
MHYRFSPIAILWTFLTAAAFAAEPDPGSEAYFSRFIRPILESSCTHCHGADDDKGDLRLHSLESCLKGVDGKPALVPGNPKKSSMYASTILPPGHDDIMPPSKEPPLTKARNGPREWFSTRSRACNSSAMSGRSSNRTASLVTSRTKMKAGS